MKPDISVIIPTYNCKPYLTACLNSVLKQSGVNLEVIVIDDGSDDGSQQWLKKVADTFPQIQLICQSNQGVIKARNTAIEKASAPYIAFLDADDVWHPDKLYKQYQFMKANPECGLTFSNYDHVDMQGRSIIDCFSFFSEYDGLQNNNGGYQLMTEAANRLLETNVIGTSSVMVKKSTFAIAGRFDPALRSASDWDCWLRIALISEVGFCSEITMDYLMREQSITSNREARLTAMSDIISKYGSHPGIHKLSEIKARARIHDSYREMYLELGAGLQAFKHALLAYVQFPHKRHMRHFLSCVKQVCLGQKFFA